MKFKKILSKIGIFFAWILMLPIIMILDLIVFVYLPIEALISLLTDSEI